jgi:RNA polymerase sigma-70 factor (ECF subfamily)
MHQELIPHLFRTEFRKIAAVLCNTFGIEHMQAAEDIASETFLTAIETWPYRGTPENPVAWLYAVAKNKSKNHIKRTRLFSSKIAPDLKHGGTANGEMDIDLSDENITDSQLKMIFAVCHHSIPVESQIALALRILCGFGIDEIATAFLTNKETINKRLFRAKEKLRMEKVELAFPGESQVKERLETVLRTLYLLFSEGYYSENEDAVLREDLCSEAMRLTKLLIEHPPTNLPAVNALLSLMCFHASRFPARKNENGELVLYNEQDESLWNKELIAKGIYFLHQSSQGRMISKYHLEASIAYWHTIKEETHEKWESILQLYNQLLQIEYSPIAALNRTYALSKANGVQQAIVEAEKLKLLNNPYYFSLLGELYSGTDKEKALSNFQSAISKAKTQADKNILLKKFNALLNPQLH